MDFDEALTQCDKANIFKISKCHQHDDDMLMTNEKYHKIMKTTDHH